jgi:hypothetical protein
MYKFSDEKKELVDEKDSDTANQMSYNSYQSHQNSFYCEEGEINDTMGLRTTPEDWKRFTVASDTNNKRFIHFPFELSDEDYLRRIYSVFSECLSEKIAYILSQIHFRPLREDVDILTLLEILSLTNQNQIGERSLQELFSRFPNMDLQRLLHLTTVFQEHRCVLLQFMKKNAPKTEFDLTTMFQLEKEFIICFETIPASGEGSFSQITTKDGLEELMELEEQYWQHKNFKDKRMNFLGWEDGGRNQFATKEEVTV